MLIHIRTGVPEDCRRVRPLQKQIDPNTEARYFTDEAFTKRLQDPKHTVLIAETKNGSVVGYAFAWVISYREHSTYLDFDCFYIDDICVLKEYRRNGIGRLLFAACKEKAKALGCKNMDLGVYAFNKDAIAFYESCGMIERMRRMELDLEKGD